MPLNDTNQPTPEVTQSDVQGQFGGGGYKKIALSLKCIAYLKN